MPRIIADAAIPFLEGRLKGAEVTRLPAPAITPEAVREADGLIVRTRTRCDRNLLEGSRVKFIATATIGTDHLDTEFLTDSGIRWANAPGCNAPGVAQYVWSALLRSGFDPQNHTLGIIGCGHVGSVVAEWGSALGTRLLVNDPPAAANLRSRGFNLLGLPELLAQADAVTIHTPLTITGAYATLGLIGEGEAELMKPGAILINAARGGITAEKAQLRRPDLRVITDTWAGEPDIDRELMRRSLFATPHIAGYSFEGKQRATRMAIEATARFFGLEYDASGLAAPYEPGNPPTAEQILDSYDPEADSTALKAAPERFEQLRASYSYRHEPLFPSTLR